MERGEHRGAVSEIDEHDLDEDIDDQQQRKQHLAPRQAGQQRRDEQQRGTKLE
jgi:hypothetical protein